jgi:hypothetical protein
VHQVGHYPELHQDARSTKHKILHYLNFGVVLKSVKPDDDDDDDDDDDTGICELACRKDEEHMK